MRDVTRKDGWGLGVSAFTAVGFFVLPWVLGIAVGLWADFKPAADIAVELYAPLEAVYLTIDPPPTELPDDADDGVVDADGQEVGADEGPVEGGEGGEAGAPEGAEAGEGDVDLGAPDDVGAPPAGGGQGGEADGEGEGEGDGKAAARKRRSSKCAEPHPNVRRGSDGIMEVDRTLVDYYTASLGRFMELGYSEPYDKNGIKGFFIGGFGCTSPVFKAGLRRGDVLITVNGKRTRTWVGVYFLYKKLKKETDFEVLVLRRGDTTPRTLRFRVVEA